MTLPDRIRSELAPAHEAIERTPFAQDMMAGRIGRAEYAAGLRQLGHLHSALEAAMAGAARHPVVAALYDPARMDRSAAIARDLAALGEVGHDDPAESMVGLADSLAEWGTATPWALVGPLYVVEGSRMGSVMIARALGRAFDADPHRPGVGLDYHTEGSATRPQDWKRFRQAMTDLPVSESEATDIVRAAAVTMDGLFEMYSGRLIRT